MQVLAARRFIFRERDVSKITPVNLPAMGEGIHEARVNCWLKQEGDAVKENEPLLQVSTDKVDTEIVAPCTGVVQRILVAPEQTVAVGALLAEIGAAEAKATDSPPRAQEASTADTTSPVNEGAGQDKDKTLTAKAVPTKRPRLLTSPLVRRRAAEQGIDLTQVRGSGLHGRITVRDLEAHTERREHQSVRERESGKEPSDSERHKKPRSKEPSDGERYKKPRSDITHAVYQQDGQEYQDGVAVRRGERGSGKESGESGRTAYPVYQQDGQEYQDGVAVRRGERGSGKESGESGRTAYPVYQQDGQEYQDGVAVRRGERGSGKESGESGKTAYPVYQQDGQEYQDGVAVRRERMNRMRRLIAAHMSASVRISPHVTTVFEVDVERIGAARQRQAEEFQRQTGFKLTWTAFFVHIAALCLKKFPLLNVSLDGNDILWKDDINIGCAVALENGLIVPVVKKAGELSLLETAHRLQDLVAKARDKQLAADDVHGGTFTITNPGIYGSLTSNPIINQPQVAILGLGRIAPTAVAIDGRLAVRQTMLVSLTFDHRVVDGEMGAKFLATYRDIAQEFG